MKSVIVMEKIKNTMQKSSKILGVICMLTIILSGCTANLDVRQMVAQTAVINTATVL